ncbi:unannotated protein [freshwater metagenome]|uniref:Unannotated protein n=1 Tax=freshwater metagenome TaxID=449393 RepID=A0A6J6EEW4_9ZZZZ
MLVVRRGTQNRHVVADGRAKQLEDFATCADVNTLRGLVEQHHGGLGLQPLAQQSLLLVTPTELAQFEVDVFRRDVELLGDRVGLIAKVLPVDSPATCEARIERKREVLEHCELLCASIRFAIRGNQNDPVVHHVLRRGQTDIFAVDRQRTVAPRARAEQQFGQLFESRAGEPGDANNLTGAKLNREVAHAFAINVASRQARLNVCARLCGLALGLHVTCAKNHFDNIEARRTFGVAGSHVVAVAEDRHAVGDLENLVEVVRNKQHGVALFLQLAKEGKKSVDFFAGQEDGWFVENQERATFSACLLLTSDGANNRDHGALNGRERVDFSVDVELQVKTAEEFFNSAALVFPRNSVQTAHGAIGIQGHVLKNGECGNESQVLVNESDTTVA